MNNPQEIADLIKALAKYQRISISKMLSDCDLNKNSLYTMQSGGYLPRTETLAKIADYLDCSVDYLLGRETANESTNISHVSNSVVMHTNRGNHVSISNGASNSDNQLSEQEEELVRTFRTLDMRRKTTALTFLYELEDQTSENRT